MTRTFAMLEVSSSTFAEVSGKLRDADYDHAFHVVDGRDVVDMHGIALTEPAADAAEQSAAAAKTSVICTLFLKLSWEQRQQIKDMLSDMEKTVIAEALEGEPNW